MTHAQSKFCAKTKSDSCIIKKNFYYKNKNETFLQINVFCKVAEQDTCL